MLDLSICPEYMPDGHPYPLEGGFHRIRNVSRHANAGVLFNRAIHAGIRAKFHADLHPGGCNLILGPGFIPQLQEHCEPGPLCGNFSGGLHWRMAGRDCIRSHSHEEVFSEHSTLTGKAVLKINNDVSVARLPGGAVWIAQNL